MAEQSLIAEIPLGSLGLFGSRNPSTIPLGGLIRADNVSFEGGTVRKEGGALAFTPSALSGAPQILGGHYFNHNGSTARQVILTSGGNLLKDTGDGSFSVTLKASLTVTNVLPVFVEAGKESAAQNRKLFVFTGVNAVQVLSADGATTSDLATPPADWSGSNQPSFGLVAIDRLWAGGNLNDPHRLYFSRFDNHETFTGADTGSISIFPGEGEKLIGGIAMTGGMLLFKYPKGIYFVDASSVFISEWSIRRISGVFGCVGLRAYAQVRDDVYFIDVSGQIRSLAATDTFSDLGTESVSDLNFISDFLTDNVDKEDLPRACMTYYATKREVQIGMERLGGPGYNNARLVIDESLFPLRRFRFSTRDSPVSLWPRMVNNVQKLMMGENQGLIYTLDDAAASKSGAGYAGVLQTAHSDFAVLDALHATRRKEGRFLELVVEPKGTWNVTIEVYWDGVLTQTILMNLGGGGAVLGSFTLGTDKLGGSTVLNRRARLVGGGRRLSLLFRNDGNGQDFSIARVFLHYVIGNTALL